jgi:uncharacterized protein (TIGR03118 family)
MRRWLRRLQRVFSGRPAPRRPFVRLSVEALEERSLLAAGFLQTNMVSDIAGMANVTDPNLINPWGLTATAEFWVAENGAGVSSLFNGIGTPNPQLPTVTIPPISGNGPGIPSGIVNNPFGQSNPTAFEVDGHPAIFIFDSQDGEISAWNFQLADPTKAVTVAGNAAADYTGLAIGKDSNGDPLLYAAMFATNNGDGTTGTTGGTIQVFNSSFQPVSLGASAFQDPSIPSNFGPFNIQNVGGLLYVEYAKIDPTTGEGQVGPNNSGFVDVYNGNGVLQKRLILGGKLDSPWGVAMAPAGFGQFGGDLLVGNFGNGEINAYDSHGKFVGNLTDNAGDPIVIDHLWALQPGDGANGQLSNAIYFTAGINNEADGLFGSLQPIPTLSTKSPLLPNLPGGALQTFSTMPTTGPDAGDQNPYGLAFVPAGFKGKGVLQPGDLLIANFNNASTSDNPTGIQGTGATIMRVTPDGGTSIFFQGPPGLGLTTALGVLKNGFVLVGSVPTPDGTAANIGPGTLFVLDANGNVVAKLTGNLLDSPWDLTINDQGKTAQVFVSNVVSGTITRLDLNVPAAGQSANHIIESETVIGSGFTSTPNDAAVILGPTGLAYNAKTGTLYVASTADNTIFSIPNAGTRLSDAGTGNVVFQSTELRGPLGMVLAPNGDLIVANGDAVNADPNNKENSELIEFTPQGKLVGEFQVDTGAGSAFGVAVSTDNGQIRFAAVDDSTNTVSVWTFDIGPPQHGPAKHSVRVLPGRL